MSVGVPRRGYNPPRFAIRNDRNVEEPKWREFRALTV